MLAARMLLAFFCAVSIGAGTDAAANASAGEAVPPAASTAEQEFEVPDAPVPLDSNQVEENGNDGPQSGLVDEWDKHMEGFVPELLLTFPLAARSDEFFYEDLPPGPPVLIRGGFFAAASEVSSSVEMSIQDPKGNVIFEKNDEPEGLFHFIAHEPGTYTFIVSNHKWMEEKMVTFAVGKGNETHLQTEHLETMEDHVKSIDKTLQDIQTESTYLWIRQKSHMKAVESIHVRVLAFCALEFMILLAISGFQVYYIKGLLSDRRVL